MVYFLKTVEEQYDKIVVTGEYLKPYIYFLFYLPKEPVEFQTKGNPFALTPKEYQWQKEKVNFAIVKEIYVDKQKVFVLGRIV